MKLEAVITFCHTCDLKVVGSSHDYSKQWSFFSCQVESHVKDALSKGAKCLRGGQRHELGGNFFQPTILTEVTRDMIICKQETFGPVAPLIRCVTHHNSCPRKLCPPFENSAV